MYQLIVAPRIAVVRAITNAEDASTASWVEIETIGPDGEAARIDLLLAEPPEFVWAAIARARGGVLMAAVFQRSDVNPLGRNWYGGFLGPAAELEIPAGQPIAGEQISIPVLAPKIVQIYSAEGAHDQLSGANLKRPMTCIDIMVGDEPGGLVHVITAGHPFEIDNMVIAARAVRKPLMFTLCDPTGVNHQRTGKPILAGFIWRLAAGNTNHRNEDFA